MVGEVKSIKKLNNGTILIETTNSKQSENLMKLNKIGNIETTVAPHRTLNHSRGVISEREFQKDLEDDILDYLKTQNVIAVHRITIKRNGQNFPTKHLILTFNTPILPKSVKIAYINCPVKPFIPNPVRCFKCQLFGHTFTACRGKQQICARCSLPDHDSNTCSSPTPKCFNCKEEHPSYSRTCPRYIIEKEIQTVKITKNISFPEARKIVNDRTPKPGITYASAINSTVIPTKITSSQNPQIIPTTINSTSLAHTTANSSTKTDTISIKKSDWLAFLAFKKLWEETLSSSSTSQTVSKNNKPENNLPLSSAINSSNTDSPSSIVNKSTPDINIPVSSWSPSLSINKPSAITTSNNETETTISPINHNIPSSSNVVTETKKKNKKISKNKKYNVKNQLEPEISKIEPNQSCPNKNKFKKNISPVITPLKKKKKFTPVPSESETESMPSESNLSENNIDSGDVITCNADESFDESSSDGAQFSYDE